MKITVTFDLNKPQWESVKKQAILEPTWHMADLIIRHNGQDKKFEADYMRDFFKEVRRIKSSTNLKGIIRNNNNYIKINPEYLYKHGVKGLVIYFREEKGKVFTTIVGI